MSYQVPEYSTIGPDRLAKDAPVKVRTRGDVATAISRRWTNK